MATRAKTTAKPKTTTRSSAKNTTTRTAASKKVARTSSATVTTVKPVVTTSRLSPLSSITPQALVGEALGTFGLALAVLAAPADQALLVGIAYGVLLLALMRITGGHFNPAVSFGLWAANKFETIKVPFYWLAQFIGALAAFMVIGAYNGNGSNLDFTNFAVWDWRIFWVELIGSTVFLFGFVAAVRNLVGAARIAGISAALVAGVVIGGGLLTANATHEQTAVQGGESTTVTQTFAAQSATLNPAIALAQTERDIKGINNSISGSSAATAKQKTPSHFTLPVVLATLIGGALGANLYLLLAGISWKAKTLEA